MSILLTAVMLLSSLACGTPSPVADAGICTTTLALGTMNELDGGFALLTDGADVTVHAGPQGGFHVFVGVEVGGAPRTGLLEWKLTSAAGAALATRTLDLSSVLLEERSCGWARPRDALIFSSNDDAMNFRGVPVQLEARLPSSGLVKQLNVVPR
ncbi:MAG: hypothetical protein GQE15_13640 [Archangiaceae bacterium]|nr:hypothetical protein [Archangiaceae bacterium]